MFIYICALVWTVAHQASQSRAFPRQGYWNGLPFPSPGIFLTQGSNPGLLHYRKILRFIYNINIYIYISDQISRSVLSNSL